jgi:putative ABC transport system permease protein
VYKTEAVRVGSGVEFMFQREKLAGLPVNYFGGVRVAPAKVAELQRASYKAYPTVSVINIADVLEIVQQVIDQIAIVVRFISAFAILAGAIILASAVAGTRFRRIRETVILKTLGGSRARVARIFSTEFAVLGAVAGLIGAVLANGFTIVIFERFFQGTTQFRWQETMFVMVLTAILANVAGWLASLRVLSVRPLEALREE